jgi:N-acetylglucosamine-6-sulfatase
VLVALFALSLTSCGQDQPRWSFVVIMTDDQRFDTLAEMPWLHENFEPKAINFANAIVTTPLCCPSRASFLAGGLPPEDTGVLTNLRPNGGATAFNDNDTLATSLQRDGYATALIGKYMNDYLPLVQRIPPGWTQFVNTDTPVEGEKWSWFDYHLSRGTSTPDAPGQPGPREHHTTYMTHQITAEATRFIAETPKDKPFFLMVSHVAPHQPSTPAPEDAGLYPGMQYTGRSIGEPDISDKPAVLRNEALSFDRRAAVVEELPGMMLRSLRAVDRGVRDVMRALERNERLDRTVVVFMSDNGFMWGEHRFFSKAVPYEESIRVPLLLLMPGAKPRRVDAQVAANLDVPATIQRLARLENKGVGRDLTPWTRQSTVQWRDSLVLQNHSELFPALVIASWSSLRTERYKYVEYDVGERELYDLVNDPLELTNIAEQPSMAGRVATMARELRDRIAITMTGRHVIDAKLGRPFDHPLTAKGGTGPYTWRTTRALPPGLALDATGRIHGTPTQAGNHGFDVQVTGSKNTRHGKKPEQYTTGMVIRVTP